MAEVTAVPLQPIRKGSLVKLWLGVLALIAAGSALAWFTVPGRVSVTTITAGMGGSPTVEDVVLINYVGKLSDGKVFDQGQGVPLPLKGMIPGFTEGVVQMQKGGKYTLEIPAAKGYGAEEKTNPQTGEVVIPANSDLTFDIDLLDFMSLADYQRREAMMQQLQQMQQQKQAGAPPPPQ